MTGRELRFTLQKAGISYRIFGENIGKSEDTIQRWISRNEIIGEAYIVGLGKLLTRRKMLTIEAQWLEFQAKENGDRLILTDGSSVNMIYGVRK
ncbi:MAG: hypothetical protein IPM69_11855 [Ignavibacteria bacterium]|nr:hypothetical protein [Ignavibacteria bacterium]